MRKGFSLFLCAFALIMTKKAIANDSGSFIPSLDELPNLRYRVSSIDVKISVYFREEANVQNYLAEENITPDTPLEQMPPTAQKLINNVRTRKKNITDQLDILFQQISYIKELAQKNRDQGVQKQIDAIQHMYNKAILRASFVHYEDIKPTSGLLKFLKISKTYEVKELIDRKYSKDHVFFEFEFNDALNRTQELIDIYNPLAKSNNDHGNATKPIYSKAPLIQDANDEAVFLLALLDRQKFKEGTNHKKICASLFDSIAL